MIFATVGTQLPFPRLLDCVEKIAAQTKEQTIAQVGPDMQQRDGLEQTRNLNPHEYEMVVNKCRVIVAHAGIGTVLSAKTHRKPLVILPRRASLGEHRNDHQIATAEQLIGSTGIYVAWEVEDLWELLSRPNLAPTDTILGPHARS